MLDEETNHLSLQITSDGKVKVVERFDCSGCGDVSTNVIVQPEDGYITSLTKKKLKVTREKILNTNFSLSYF